MQADPISTEKPRRRRYSAAFREQVVEESFNSQLSVARVAMKHGINANLLHTWRWHYRRARGLTRESSRDGLETRALMVPAYVQPELASHEARPDADDSPGLEVRIGSATIRIRRRADVALLREVIQVLTA